MKKLTQIILLSAYALFAISCSTLPYIPYKIDIDQGHLITPEDAAKLQVGMTKKQVALIVGTPLLIDTFNQNRWDYPQYYRNGKTQEIVEGKLTVFFKDDRVSHINSSEVIEVKQEPVHYDNLSNPLNPIF